MKVRTIYLMKDVAKDGAVVKPKVFLERTASGAITCGVHVTARTLRQARERAQEEFSALLAYAKRQMAKEEGKR